LRSGRLSGIIIPTDPDRRNEEEPDMDKTDLSTVVAAAVEDASVLDVHTHLYSPPFGELLLWGIDELLTYHYLICETLIHAPMPYDEFYAMPKHRQAEYVWDTLFVQHTPVSEATRGVVTTLKTLGFEPREASLDDVRRYFDETTVEDYVDFVFEKANVEAVVMTNDVFDGDEQAVWANLTERDSRFLAAMRIDGLLNDWAGAVPRLRESGYQVNTAVDDATVHEVLRFLSDHAERMNPVYLAASLPPDFTYPDLAARGVLIDRCILPFCREHDLPFAMMIGVKKLINPPLQLAGDGLGLADLTALESICRDNPDNKFLVTYLSRENQHAFAVTARKFHNLMVFGCWWFLNIPSAIAEITAERVELLGARFVPQHSDARILDQLLYKWSHSRHVIGDVLTQKYADLMNAGWALTEADVKQDVRALFSENAKNFVGL
jgi:hypothetical protein